MKFTYQMGLLLLGTVIIVPLLGSCSQPKELATLRQEHVQPQAYNQSDMQPELIEAMNRFALTVYNESYQKDPDRPAQTADPDNLFISPVSLYMNLSMLYNGASGQTAAELQKALHTRGITLQQLNQGQHVIQELLEHQGADREIDLAGSLWSQSGFAPADSFVQRLQTYYGAGIHTTDFTSTQAVKDINRWVSEATHGGIRQMIQKPLDSNTTLVLLNAVYFTGEWTEPFEKQQTRKQSFISGQGEISNVEMMHQQGEYEYTRQPHFQAVRIPYNANEKWGMVVVLPDRDYDLQQFRQHDLPEFVHWTSAMGSTAGEIGLPRLELDEKQQFRDILRSMGIRRVFEPQQAELDGISESVPLYLSKVQQNTHLTIDEKGTEAAAATSAEIAAGAMPSQPFRMIMDRPFFLAITDRTTGLIVFMGELHHPVGAGS
ncbi:serpin family protein [Paenibacillus bovis]|uniref:Serpin domain-containing protein n=1 Tax=Paenibacillus bovis TaxID=1616788 RepID=A0A172ZD98_9BACL|nr:serpin family protein [Paenibacillus bovis]ANF95615.1 hypothetical protein AR543_06115 [Paenibacillus bovis]